MMGAMMADAAQQVGLGGDAAHFSPAMVALLELGQPTLSELLDLDDTVLLVRYRLEEYAEIKALLLAPETLALMLDLLCAPSPSGSEAERLRYPAVLAELLSSRVPALDEALAQDALALARLFAFYDQPELPVLYAPGVGRVLAALLEAEPLKLRAHLQADPQALHALLLHAGQPSLSAALVTLVRMQALPEAQDTHAWLLGEGVLDRLLDLLEQGVDGVGALLGECLGALAWDAPLVQALAQDAPLQRLLDLATDRTTPQALKHALPVLRELLRCAHESGQPQQWAQAPLDELPQLHQALLERLFALGDLLEAPPHAKTIQDAAGRAHAACGWVRVRVLELLGDLARLGYAAVLQSLSEADLLAQALDLMFNFEHCNVAHELLVQLFAPLLALAAPPVALAIVERTRLLETLVTAHRLAEAEVQLKRPPLPYAVYAYRMAHALLQATLRPEHAALAELCAHTDGWAELQQTLQGRAEAERRLHQDEIAPLPPGYATGRILTPEEAERLSGYSDAPPAQSTPPPQVPPQAQAQDPYAELDGALEEAAPRRSVANAIDSILSGEFDETVQDSSRLKNLTLDDILAGM